LPAAIVLIISDKENPGSDYCPGLRMRSVPRAVATGWQSWQSQFSQSAATRSLPLSVLTA